MTLPRLLAIAAAFLFALAAALQQRGVLRLRRRGAPVAEARHLLGLARERDWLAGTAVLLAAYGLQAAALRNGRLVVIQPLLVLTLVFALPLGRRLTAQRVNARQVGGAAMVVLGLTAFITLGNPDLGLAHAATARYAAAIAGVGVLTALAVLGARAARRIPVRAALLGSAAGMLFGLSAMFAKPTLDELSRLGLGAVLTHVEVYGLLVFGGAAFVIQQLALAAGTLAPAVAATGVANPAVSVVLGMLLFAERLRPSSPWVAVLALLGLALAFLGAAVVTLADRQHGTRHRSAVPTPTALEASA